MKTAIELIADERQRQQFEEHWTHEHDDSHTDGALAIAAAELAANGTDLTIEDQDGPDRWGLVARHGYAGTKPNRQRALVIAGALIVAEIERLQRKAQNE